MPCALHLPAACTAFASNDCWKLIDVWAHERGRLKAIEVQETFLLRTCQDSLNPAPAASVKDC
jgi:hypothetical protein